MAITLTAENFDNEVINSEVPVLVDFWAPWCGPCKMLGPVIEEIANDFADKPVKIAKLNVDDAPAVASQFGIMSIPTLILFKGGVVTEQMIGMQSKEDLVEKLEKLIA